MLQNRTLQVKMVKDTPGESQPGETHIHKSVVDTTEVAGAVLFTVGSLIAIYMATDTLRKVAIHTAATKIQ